MPRSAWVVPAGFEKPVYQVLLKPKLVLGAPRKLSIFIVMSIAISVLWHLWPVIPFGVILQRFAAWGTRQDPQFFAIIWRARVYKKYYAP